MEAFILAEKVITSEHMTPDKDRPKYLRKYDLPLTTSKPRIQTLPLRKPYHPAALVNASRTKHLLLQLIGNKENKDLERSTTKIEKYFTVSSQPFRGICRKTKNGLLIRRVEPRPLHYDANFTSVSKRAPSWGFLPEHSQQLIPTPQTQTPPIPSKTQPQKRRPKTRGVEIGEFLDGNEGCVGERRESDPRLDYDAEQLGKCTAQIFKKYHLDNDPYFKKIVAGLPS